MVEDTIKNNFQAADFISFGVILGISCLIGIYFAYKDRKNSSMDNYFFGGRSMHPAAVGMSLAVTFQSAVGFISDPAESYIVGNLGIWGSINKLLPALLTAVYFIPAWHRIPARTTFEFLELRFNSTLRRFAALLRILSAIFVIGLVVYVPAVAINAVTPLSLNWSIILTSVVCIFYTTLGGMKAVIWTDAVQLVFIFAGIAAITIQGLIAIGGLDNLMSALGRGERYTAFRFDYGIVSRISPLGKMLGGLVQYINIMALSQEFVQRCQSCKTARHARYALLIYLFPSAFMGLALTTTGLVTYAYYEGCDPVMSGQISSIDQIVPYMALELFADLPGLAGIFIASIFSAALSTVSSSLNSFSMVVVEDLMVPFWDRLAKSESLKVFVGKVVVVVLGVLLLGVAFTASLSQSNVMQLFLAFTGTITGPLTATFILGFFVPWTNSLGATVGLLIGFAFGLFMFIGNEFLRIPYPANIPPRTTDLCPVNSTITPYESTGIYNNFTTAAEPEIQRSAIQDFYNLNYHTFAFFSMCASLLVSLFTSFITGPNKPQEADPKLFIPLVESKCFPSKVRRFFRFGVPERKEKTDFEISSISSISIKNDKL